MNDLTASQRALLHEGQAALECAGTTITRLAEQLDCQFVAAVERILECQGHVIVSGAGTSASVARRLAHLLTNAGAPALYLDASESAHGASRAVTARDLLIAISKGGETDELNHLARMARLRGAKVIALTGPQESTLARLSDVAVPIKVEEGVDAYGVIALGSSLAAAAVGDAICFAVLSVRGYDSTAFGQAHPLGAVGKRLQKARSSN
jgi:arabinose-5-phosphate isomerase